MNRIFFFVVMGFVIILSVLRQTVISLANNISTAPSVVPPVSIRDDDDEGHIGEEYDKPSNALTESDSDPLLFVSTLDGSFNAVKKGTGQVVWTLKENPVLTTPVTFDYKNPMFLTNPKDGSLYTFGGIGFDSLKKLPFTIPDLVTSSPCRSTDGILYTGYKKDTWFSIDPLTGIKVHTLDMNGLQHEFCPTPEGGGGEKGESTIFIGRTEYTIVMFNSKTNEIRWNATFMDYSTHVDQDDPVQPGTDYDLRHFASSSTGALVTTNEEVGDVTWTQDYGSPVVAIYTLDARRALRKIPLVSVASETLEHLTGQVTSTEWLSRFHGAGGGPARDHFYPTLYIGEQTTCFYALPSLIDTSNVMIASRNFRPLLIGGPDSGRIITDSDGVSRPSKKTKEERDRFILLGHHEVPDLTEVQSVIGARRQIADKSGGEEKILPGTSSPSGPLPVNPMNEMKVNTEPAIEGGDQFSGSNSTKVDVVDSNNVVISSQSLVLFVVWSAFLILVISYCMRRMRVNGQESQGQTVQTEVNSSEYSSLRRSSDGMIIIGKISFDPTAVLGHGCAGTFVYKGRFDGRNVAVKRILPTCFTIADREVALLRESDQHPNVVRYFVTERDAEFCYIALELCSATLQDYVERRGVEVLTGGGWDEVDPVQLLRETMSGIAHLHSLNIVHRDIKPHNVLLSMPTTTGSQQLPRVRAMISDFGLCKKLSIGRQSVSNCSGATGTDGWIAPEMMLNHDKDVQRSMTFSEEAQRSTTCAVDVFSSGCLIYYVLTEGHHPFGDPVLRQSNILSGHRCLEALDERSSRGVVASCLVTAMIERVPASRPSANSVVRHAFFWNGEKTLSFFDAVSDKLEKLHEMDPSVLRLECDGLKVVRTDWSQYITEDLRQDLRRFRSYKSHSVRDLLRAIRNKRHHFRELNDDLKNSFGHTTDEFVNYFTSRFPRLLAHVYDAMSWCSAEPALSQFY